MATKKLSIIIPVYNEAQTIHLILNKIKEVILINELNKEIIIVDDCSTDRTPEAVTQFRELNPELNLIYHRQNLNRGKGAAIRAGIKLTSGDYVVIQDADLEYDPEDYNLLLGPMLKGYADVVYGSRLMSGRPHRILFFWHTIGNKFLTFVSNALSNLNLTDMETGYKLFKTNVIMGLQLREDRFGFEPEVTAKIANIKGIRIYEVGISYFGRTYDEGKKIRWIDGIRALYCIIKYNLFSKR